MPQTVNQVQVFLPVLVLIALTFVAFVKMGMARGQAVKGGQNPDYYRAAIGDPEPEAVRAVVRHWGNLFELPTVFYAGCIAAFVLEAVGTWTLAFAWAFVAGRLLQSAVHLTYNNPAHRGMGFVVSVIAALALWVNVALAVFARL